MQYFSTRNEKNRATASQAILSGLASDGGLYVPEQIPQVDYHRLLGLSYRQRAKLILADYLTDFTEEEIAACVDGAYTAEHFGSDVIAPLAKVGDAVSFLELWHGPTCAFKDMALQILPYFLTTSMKKQGEDKTVVILVATSGDTGKAALAGFANVPGTKIAVFYPDQGVSKIQRLQMVTQEGANVFASGVKGNFDDVQAFVKQIFTDQDYRANMSRHGFDFSSANSINWGRLVPQIVYYIHAYCQLVDEGEIQPGETVNVTVPTGNFGNILAAFYAKQAGIPIGKLICASNRNKILTDFIRTGVYDKNRDFYVTQSPSMDILISSNLERLLYHLSDEQTVRELMTQLKETGRYEAPPALRQALGELLWADFCDDTETEEQIAAMYREYGYVMDPHTAVGYGVYQKYAAQTGDQTKTVIASTASPFKFNACVAKALGEETCGISEFALLHRLAEKTGLPLPPSLSELEQSQVRFDGVVDKDGMYGAVSRFLGI